MDLKEINEIWIDIRDEHELIEGSIVAPNAETLVINIPGRNIFANVHWIKSVASNGKKITLICRSANRSNKVKNTYFSMDENIFSLDGGVKNPIVNLSKNENPGLAWGLQQYLQVMFSIILFSIIVLSFYLDIQKLRYFILAIIGFIYYQVFSKSCLIGRNIPLYVPNQ